MTNIVESPCINTCKLDPSGSHCIGCFRTASEIGEWSRASSGRQMEIVSLAKKRKANCSNEWQ